MKKKYVSSILTLSTLAVLTGCLGGKATLTSGSTGSTISGVAATGAPISGGQVQIKGSNGATVSDITGADGSYSADVSSLNEPYLVRVIAPSGEKYITVASQSALAEGRKINVTPLTHTIVANVFASANADDIFTNFESKSRDFSESKLQEQKRELLQKLVAAGLAGEGKIVPANVDLLNGTILAGTSAGVDGLLDVIQVNTDATAGIEIKLKGVNTPVIVDKVNAPDPSVSGISNDQLVSARAQLSIIDQLRERLKALAALHSSKVACAGVDVNTIEAASPCNPDLLHTTFLPFFHPEFNEEGNQQAEGVWSWICDNDDANSRDTCGILKFQSVSLKDITLIHYDETTKVALISFNVYMNGVLHGMEEMFLKKDSTDNQFKLLGNRKSFKYWIETQSLVENKLVPGSATPDTKYSVNLNFYYKGAGSYHFSNGASFTLTSSKAIFPNNSTTMPLYLVTGPQWNENGQCSTGLVFSTTSTPYKVFDPTNSTPTDATFAEACTNGDACHCQPGGNKFAYYDHENAQKITLSASQVALMDRIEKVSLSGSGVSGDVFTIRKPLLLNEFNAPLYAPRLNVTIPQFCANQDPQRAWNVSVGAGYLSHVNINYGIQAPDMTWKNANDNEDFHDDGLKTTTFAPQFTNLANGDVVRGANIWLSARDEFDRQFVRQISCH